MATPADRLWRNARLATMADAGAIEDGAVAAKDGRIVYAGPAGGAPDAVEIVDCGGRWVTPGLIDCHTHLVYAGDRAREFELRLQGASYEEIARAGGGIVSTMQATRAASEAELVAMSLPRLDALIAEGVTTVEIKSGYGLTVGDERKMLRAARALGESRAVRVLTTFLGAHAVPPEYRDDAEGYIDHVCETMIPQLASLSDAVDAFCEGIGFSRAHTERVFNAAAANGLPVKLHAEQLSNSGGAALAAEHRALSADHLEHLDATGVAAMSEAGTVAVLLPGAFYFMRETQLPPIEALRAAGVPLAIATDCNPGTSPMTSLLLAMNMGATLFRLTVEECLLGVTRHAAQALGLGHETGTLEPGKACDLAIWDIESPAELVYRIGFNPLHARVMGGRMILRPGHVTLGEWRAIYAGARPSLDPSCHMGIAASAAAVEAILARHEPVYGINTGFGKLASVKIGDADLETLQRNIVLSHAAGVGEPVPVPIVRLMLALKLASLAQGASGVRPATIAMLEDMLARDVMPVIPGQGSVGASGDLAPLAHMAAAMIGVGEVIVDGARRPAAEVLTPLTLGPKEGLALLNGTQFSCAHALAGLFETERLFRAALVTGALSTEAAKGSDTPFDPRIHALRGHRGQIEVADALRGLMAGSAIRASHAVNDERVQDPYCLRCQPQVMGACLDLLRQAAATLAIEANGVTDNPLIFAETGEALSGGNFHAEPVAFAADMIALAICEIGSLAERRVAMLVDPALSGLPAFLTPHPGLNSGFMIPQVTAAALVSENKQRAYPASVDSIPTSANQEDHVSMAAHGARRLLGMAANLAHVIGIEYLAAAQGCDFHAPLRSSALLEQARALLRATVPMLQEDRHFAPDMAVATALLGAFEFALPGVEA